MLSASLGESLWDVSLPLRSYQVDLMVLVEEAEALLGLQLLLVLSLHTLVLENIQKTQKLQKSMQKHSWRLTRTEGWKLIGGQTSSLKSKKAMK